APRIGTAVDAAIADEDGGDARILALAGLEVDPSLAKTFENGGRELVDFALEVRPARDEVRLRQGLWHRLVPVDRRDQVLGDESQDRITARRTECPGEAAVAR